MKKLLFLLSITMVVFFGCQQLESEVEIIKETAQKVAIGFEKNGDTAYIKSQDIKVENSELRRPGNGNGNGNNGNGGGKKVRVAQLSLPTGQLSTFAVTNVMLDPVEYTGALPTDDNGGLVDWDGDGNVDDLIEYDWRCYFPRSFAQVNVYIDGVGEPRMINNSIAFGAVLLGFADVDGDGDQDIIWEGGNHRKYNADDNGIIEPYSQYNVGYNTLAEEPTPIGDLVESLVLTQSVNNPQFIRWDLGPQYEAYVFHVYWTEIDPITQEPVPGGISAQTHTYGEFGIIASAFNVGSTYRVRFTNAKVTADDECAEAYVIFTL